VLGDFGHKVFDKGDEYYFEGGEDAALSNLEYYFSKTDLASNYYESRNDSLGRDYSTKCSAYLSSGCLSPKYLYQQLKIYESNHGESKSTYWIFFELLWRDFFRLIGKKYKEKIFLKGGIQDNSEKFSKTSNLLFERWQKGQTGIPFIDASMRQMNQTGFMSNRGRQVVASYLVHDMRVNWQLGASYFESLLIDYDPCSNYCNWNYIAGIGNDPRENRKFNPVLQSKRYDPEAKFILKWLPELSGFPNRYIHNPSEITDEELNVLKSNQWGEYLKLSQNDAVSH
jgi:deoxyribodipyrimidine photo-lyase